MSSQELARANTYMLRSSAKGLPRAEIIKLQLRAYRNYADHFIQKDPKCAAELKGILRAIHDAEAAMYESRGNSEIVCANAEIVICCMSHISTRIFPAALPSREYEHRQ